MSGLDQLQTPVERTLLSWQRTMLALITVAGVGALRLLLTGEAVFLSAALILLALSGIPVTIRYRAIHARDTRRMTWEPIALVSCIVALAVAALISLAVT